MKKLILTAASFILLIGSAYSSDTSEKETDKTPVMVTFSGRIIGIDTNEPLAGVLIKADEEGNRLYSDLEGNFNLTAPASSQIELTFSYISYETRKVKLELTENTSDVVEVKLSRTGSN